MSGMMRRRWPLILPCLSAQWHVASSLRREGAAYPLFIQWKWRGECRPRSSDSIVYTFAACRFLSLLYQVHHTGHHQAYTDKMNQTLEALKSQA